MTTTALPAAAGDDVEPIRMPKMPQYKPQIDVDDPDTYMMLVPANINTKMPIIQIACTGLAILFAVAALAKDEMSDGDIVFSTGASEVDYDCGWNSYRLNIDGYSETYKYGGAYCSNNDEIIDEEFCNDSVRNGALWLSFNIVGICALIAAIPIILNKQCGGKHSIAFYILVTIGMSSFGFSSFWWWTQDRCEDVEEYDTVFTEADFDTSPGPSLYLMWTAIVCCLVVFLLTSLHVCNARAKAQQARSQSDQARLSHAVNQPL